MASHTVAEAKNHLSELIEKAIGGEEVVITRHGTPVAMIKPVVRQPGPITDEEIAWLRAHRVRGTPPKEDAGAMVSRMRDEDWR
jgi:prevent-host-death family protein